ncbi:hypothetical protein L2Z53_11955 (plasmid) [Macrococcoides canis]|uniref:hypothetical protein n=1 Tax=Macrococcoides canis TaxID=1855823 RepID=UPI001F2A0AB2|nr:hypothetical protein [Macrococcus canis]UJS29049.1 hypothetical protein L2Z53_11955 [Macrococcus canis]
MELVSILFVMLSLILLILASIFTVYFLFLKVVIDNGIFVDWPYKHIEVSKSAIIFFLIMSTISYLFSFIGY